LARLRDNYAEFTSRGAEILAVGPDKLKPFAKYWRENRIPFVGLPDPKHQVAKLYKQEVNLFKLGRMPMNSIVDREGHLRFVHYGLSMSDIPDNETFLKVIDELNNPSK
jgi:peroxiredoxin Q/BCP